MPDLEISKLPALAGNALQGVDPVPLTDLSASETKKITVKDLIQFGVTLIDAGSIPGDRVNITLPAGSVGTLEIADNSITALKMADGSSGIVQAGPLPNGEYIGQLGVDTADNKLRVWDGGAWRDVKGAASINAVNGSTAGLVQIVATTTGDTTTLAGSIAPTTAAREFLAGPTGAAGTVTARPIVGGDLPVATNATPGAVIVSGGGLKVDGNGNVDVDNAVVAQGARSLATWNSHGLVTGGSPLTNVDLPLASAGNRGAIIPGPDFAVTPSGELQLTNSVIPATYAKVTVSGTGLVTAGQSLDPTDIPGLDASKITTGTIAAGRIGNKSITREMLADYAIAYIQEATPPVTGVPIGELWFQESTAQLSMWNGNSWFPVGQARLTAENLRYCGTIDADTNLITGVTKFGTGAGYVIGDTPKTATDQQIGVYFVVSNPGSNIVFVPGTSFDNGDWLLCNGAVSGTGWERIDTLNSGGGGGGASNLGDLLDVTLTMPQAGQSLVFTAGGQWVNAASPAAPSTTPPTSPTGGQLWVDTSVDPPVVKVYDATAGSWVEVGKQPADASETVKGIIELATQAEVDAGTDAVRAVTPATLKQYVATASPAPADASETVKGIIELATNAEVTAGTDTVRAVTPAGVKAVYLPLDFNTLAALP